VGVRALEALSPLVLASRSPQRRAILTLLGVEFRVEAPDYEEVDPPGATPQELVRAHAVGKVRSVAGERVLGVDTTVDVDGDSLAKAAGEEEARGMLWRLSGRAHEVHSGLCLRAGGREIVRVATTRVLFRRLSDDDVEWYVASGEWRDRAGSYAVQGRGAAFVRAVEGDYQNVVGLPVAALVDAAGEVTRLRATATS
jgi:nucleoside triphosphate pyrophosphatase